MRMQRVKILVALIGVMVLALIVVQFILLQLDFSRSRKQVDLRVSKCLQSISADISNNEYCAPTYSKAFVDSGERVFLMHAKHNGSLDTLSLFYDEKYTQDSLVGRLNYLKFRHPFKLEVSLNALITEPDSRSFLQGKSNFETAKKTDRLKEVMGSLIPIDSVFDMTSIRSAIKKQLLLDQIDTNFSFALLANGYPELNYFSKRTDSNELKQTKYKSVVFNDNPFMQNYYLHLHLPLSYAQSEIVWFHLLPLFIILFLLTALFLFAKLFFRQIHLNRMKSNFIHNVAHELNTPLANISLALETLDEEQITRNAKTKTLLNIISTESGRLHENIEKSLHLARMEDSSFQLQKEVFDIVDLLNTVLISYRYKCEELGGEIRFNQTDYIAFYGDETHILNCVVNILDNAIKYRSAKPIIEVCCRDTKDRVEIEIKDNGIGMSSITSKHAFDKFYRANEGDEHNSRGFGLGLSYVKSIVELHGGSIDLNSKLGDGTIFVLRFNKYWEDG